jgi:hypothetical protein
VILCDNSPSESAAEVAPESGSHHRLLGKLMATVRPGFRVDIVRFDPTDPVFGGPPCRVPDCRRPARSRDLCLGHHSRWRDYGRPDLEEFAATVDPRFAREVLLACQVPGCRYGVNGHGLCGRHLARWRQARRPNLAGWPHYPLKMSKIHHRLARSQVAVFGGSRAGHFVVPTAEAGSTTIALTSATT